MLLRMDRTDFYVYEHRTDCGRTFYVGKGRLNRAWDYRRRHEYWKRTRDKYGANTFIVYEGLSEREALRLEVDLIAAYGRDNLCNLTDGGEGTAGLKWMDEQRENMSDVARKRWESDEYRRKFSDSRSGEKNPHFGKRLSDEVRAKISESHMGDKNHFYGKTHSPESKLKMAAAKTGERSPKFDPTIRTYKHPELGIFTGTQNAFWKRYGLKRDSVSRLSRGISKVCHGWVLISC